MRFMRFHRKPGKQPVARGLRDVADLLAAAPGPGLKHRAALGIGFGARPSHFELCHFDVRDIGSEPMLIRVDDGKGDQRLGSLLPLQPWSSEIDILYGWLKDETCRPCRSSVAAAMQGPGWQALVRASGAISLRARPP